MKMDNYTKVVDNDTVSVYRWRTDTTILISLGFDGSRWLQTVGVTVPLKYVRLMENYLTGLGYKERRDSEMEGYLQYKNRFHKVFLKREDSGGPITLLFTGSIWKWGRLAPR